MFWKTLGIIWTVLLLVAVALLWQSQYLRAGSGATEAVEQEGPPRGTQMTAFVAEVPTKYMSLAPELIHMRSVRGRALMRPEIMKWPQSFRQKVLLEPRKYYSVRPVGPKESGILAIDARACESDAQAYELAEAVAEAFINEVQSAERRKLDSRIKHAHASLKPLRLRMDKAQTEMARLCGGSWFPGKGDSLAFHEARVVSERLIDAGVRFERARVRLMAAQEAAARGPRAAEMPAAAPRPVARGAGAIAPSLLEELEWFIADAESDAAAETRPVPSSTPADLLEELEKFIPDAESDAAAETRPAPSSKPAEPVAGPGRPSTTARRITALRQAVEDATAEVASLEDRKRELKHICTDVARQRSRIMTYEQGLTMDLQSCAKLDALVLELRMERECQVFAPRLVGVVLVK